MRTDFGDPGAGTSILAVPVRAVGRKKSTFKFFRVELVKSNGRFFLHIGDKSVEIDNSQVSIFPVKFRRM